MRLSVSPSIPGQDAPHELVEERNGECCFSVSLAPDHAFRDEAGTSWRERGDAAAELVCDVARSLRVGTEFGHRAKIPFLCWGEAIEADAEEALVESGDSFVGGVDNVLITDGAGGSEVPGVLAPLLEEVGVALGFGDDADRPRDRRWWRLHSRRDGRWLRERKLD